jgi:hypothetical protein
MTPTELSTRAVREAHELGDPPDDPTDRSGWIEARHSAVELLAALAEHDDGLLQQAAALIPANESPTAHDLLAEAASSS